MISSWTKTNGSCVSKTCGVEHHSFQTVGNHVRGWLEVTGHPEFLKSRQAIVLIFNKEKYTAEIFKERYAKLLYIKGLTICKTISFDMHSTFWDVCCLEQGYQQKGSYPVDCGGIKAGPGHRWGFYSMIAAGHGGNWGDVSKKFVGGAIGCKHFLVTRTISVFGDVSLSSTGCLNHFVRYPQLSALSVKLDVCQKDGVLPKSFGHDWHGNSDIYSGQRISWRP